jgi:hypothetical protein
MTVDTMKNRLAGYARQGAMLAYCAMGVVWSAHALADDEAKPAVTVAHEQERQVRLPALKAGGMHSGRDMVITESGVENVVTGTPDRRHTSKLSAFADDCIPR